MGIRFQCPSCKVIRSANERLLGRVIRCPSCGKPVQLPTRDQVERLRQKQMRSAGAQVTRSRPATAAATPAPRAGRQAAGRPAVAATAATSPAAPAKRALSPEEQLEAEERALAAAQTSFRRVEKKEESDMDMTPMVDVTFLLLIFFMITASFSVQKAFKTPAQKSDDPSMNPVEQPEDENPDIVTVQIDELNAYNVITTDWDRVAGNKQDLIVLLSQARQGDSSGNQPSKVVVQAHEDCIHAAVVDALDAAREVGFESFEISTVEQFD